MDYAEAVDTAPPGWRHFSIDDIARLPEDVQARELARVPQHEPDDRVLRALFWTLVYHLAPERWDALSRCEPIHPDLIAALPTGATRAIDVGAGSGRLTEHLVKVSGEVIAVEPSAGLRSILARRLPGVHAVAGWAEALPVEDGWSRLTAVCGAFGPDRAIMAELARVTARGGCIALISPEHPEWFEASGWLRISVPRMEAPAHPRWIDDFFGPPDPPHEMVLTEVS